jgi:hypothetical protein
MRHHHHPVTICYHGTPITPNATLLTLAGKHFCVSHMRPDQVAVCHQIGQSVMLDNGAFSKWKSGKAVNWPAYYEWCDKWLDYPTTWAVIPDEIEAGSQEQDALIREWPHGDRGAPVWHMDEPLDRALRLADEWPRICFGANGEFSTIPGPAFTARMDAVWNELAKRHRRTPNIHMLRGMQLTKFPWPFASVDSTDVAQNHHLPHRTARAMADRWDATQCPPTWAGREAHPDLFEVAA